MTTTPRRAPNILPKLAWSAAFILALALIVVGLIAAGIHVVNSQYRAAPATPVVSSQSWLPIQCPLGSHRFTDTASGSSVCLAGGQ